MKWTSLNIPTPTDDVAGNPGIEIIALEVGEITTLGGTRRICLHGRIKTTLDGHGADLPCPRQGHRACQGKGIDSGFRLPTGIAVSVVGGKPGKRKKKAKKAAYPAQ
jgi:hypothetical protein